MKDKLWQTVSVKMNPIVESFTVGDDYLYDQKLLGYDIKASKAHAVMLAHAGLISDEEAGLLSAALEELHGQWENGNFTINPEQEDGHTATEDYLTEKLGDTGKKIHTGRSRNDQSLVMTRLFLKQSLKELYDLADQVSKAFEKAASKHGDVPMPGYTHMQKAMPTTLSAWFGAYADAVEDTLILIDSTLKTIDQNPLGSAAGLGTNLPIDRKKTTQLLDFARTQENPLYCGLSRGFFELLFVQAMNPLIVLAGKFANDMMLFTTEEFGYFSLPASFTTGSSIMPHKANYDLFEILRGRAHAFGSKVQQLQSVAVGVGSGYHRDLQLTKKITVDAFEEVGSCLRLLLIVLPELIADNGKLTAAITPNMQSVEAINKLVLDGTPFREAYRQVKQTLR